MFVALEAKIKLTGVISNGVRGTRSIMDTNFLMRNLSHDSHRASIPVGYLMNFCCKICIMQAKYRVFHFRHSCGSSHLFIKIEGCWFGDSLFIYLC